MLPVFNHMQTTLLHIFCNLLFFFFPEMLSVNYGTLNHRIINVYNLRAISSVTNLCRDQFMNFKR